MNVGLPGTGIGGIFYLLSILIMIAIEAVRFLFGKTSACTALASRQALLLVGIIASMIGLNWFLGAAVAIAEKAGGGIHGQAAAHPAFLSITPIVMTVGMLAVVIVIVHLIAFFTKGGKTKM